MSLGLVPGDLIVLAGSNLIPADAIVIEMQGPACRGSGPHRCVLSFHQGSGFCGPPLFDENMVHMGTSIRSASGLALVIQTGNDTQYQAIATALARQEPEPALPRASVASAR